MAPHPHQHAHMIDVCALPAPEPMERVLAALEQVAPGAALQVLIHREPLPLFDLLARRGHRWTCCARADGRFDLVIMRAPCSAP